MRIINLELFGHPVNILVVLAAIFLFWFAVYKVSAPLSAQEAKEAPGDVL